MFLEIRICKCIFSCVCKRVLNLSGPAKLCERAERRGARAAAAEAPETPKALTTKFNCFSTVCKKPCEINEITLSLSPDQPDYRAKNREKGIPDSSFTNCYSTIESDNQRSLGFICCSTIYNHC